VCVEVLKLANDLAVQEDDSTGIRICRGDYKTGGQFRVPKPTNMVLATM